MVRQALLMVSNAAALLLGAALLLSAPVAQAQDCRAEPSPKINWQGCNKKNLMLGDSDFTSANFVEADLSFTDLRGTTISSANFEKSKLIRASLVSAKADNANFSRVEAYRSDFQKISAEGANFAGAELQRANFNGAILKNAGFEKAELSRVSFDKAILTGASFAFANLARADLSGASFQGTLNFTNAFLLLTRIEGLDLSAASGLTQAEVDIACGDSNTKLPTGLKMPASWPCGDRD